MNIIIEKSDIVTLDCEVFKRKFACSIVSNTPAYKM